MESYKSVLTDDAAPEEAPLPVRPHLFDHAELSASLAARRRGPRGPRGPAGEGSIVEDLFAVYDRHREYWSQFGLLTRDDFPAFLALVRRHCKVDAAAAASARGAGADSDSGDDAVGGAGA